MKTLTTIALSLTIVASNSPSFAATWADQISATTSVTGPAQAADHSTPWMAALDVEQTRTGQPQPVAKHGPLGFLAEAEVASGGTNGTTYPGQIAGR